MTVSGATQVLLGDEPVSTRKVMLSVIDPSKVTLMALVAMMMTMVVVQVSHKTQYVIKKAGGNVTLDCTDFTGEQEAAWRKLGGQSGFDSDLDLEGKLVLQSSWWMVVGFIPGVVGSVPCEQSLKGPC